jgi:glucose-6-phosphate isomerase, archaeal
MRDVKGVCPNLNSIMNLSSERILSRFNPLTGEIDGAPMVKRYLSDLRGCFADAQAFERAVAAGDPLVYTVVSVEPAGGDGDLHYGLGRLLPGRVGDEYYLTKGHLHAWRDAAEFYIGLAGEGVMLLEDEATGESRMVELQPNGVVYVPGRTAHRTINVGMTPLTYLGVYPARAGHDYGTIAQKNFRCVIVERNGRPTMLERG